MIQQFILGAHFALSGFSLITKKGIRQFVIIPLLINIVVFSAAVWLAMSQFESLMGVMTDWLPGWLFWIQWLLWPLFALLILITVYYTFTIIANFLASPFNSLLAERIERKLCNEHIPEFQGYREFMGTIAKTLLSEIRKMFYLLKWLPVLLIVSVIPVVNFVAPFAWAMFGAWMLSLQYTDYPMGNHQLFIKQELNILRKNRGTALGFGGMLTIMMVIPVLNFFVMPVGVAGGTVFWVKKLSQSRQTEHT